MKNIIKKYRLPIILLLVFEGVAAYNGQHVQQFAACGDCLCGHRFGAGYLYVEQACGAGADCGGCLSGNHQPGQGRCTVEIINPQFCRGNV